MKIPKSTGYKIILKKMKKEEQKSGKLLVIGSNVEHDVFEVFEDPYSGLTGSKIILVEKNPISFHIDDEEYYICKFDDIACTIVEQEAGA